MAEERKRGGGRHRLHPPSLDALPADLSAPLGGGIVSRRRPGIERADEPFALAAHLPADGAMPVGEAMAVAVADWVDQARRGRILPVGVDSYSAVSATLLTYLDAASVELVCDISSETVWRWVNSPATGVRAAAYPTDNTRMLRRSTAGALWTTWYRLGITERNVAASLPPITQPKRKVAPLTERQIQQLKDLADYDSEVSTYESGYSRTPTCLALTLLGAQSGEVSAVRVGDVDLLNRRVYLHGGGERYRHRWVPIDDGWAWEALAARVAYLSNRYANPEMLVGYKPQSDGPHTLKDRAAATSGTLGRLLKTAGVYQPGRNRVASIVEYVALRVFHQTGRVEAVAARLGMANLDRAAHLVGYEWQTEYNPDPGTAGGRPDSTGGGAS